MKKREGLFLNKVSIDKSLEDIRVGKPTFCNHHNKDWSGAGIIHGY